MTKESITCQNCKTPFTIEPEDFAFYEKMHVPPPTFCPRCRSQRRMSHRNDYCFYYRTCGLCKQKTLSIYSEDKAVPVLCPTCWWGDGWDAKQFARDVDFTRPFFPQFRELLNSVPALAILNDNGIASTNCEYTNYFALGKDCYLVVNSWKVENCMYSSCLVGAKDVVDSTILLANCENLYAAVYVDNSSLSRNVYNCSGLMECAYCLDCRGCTNCFMCVGLRNKKYCFQNKQYTKEEYQKILQDYRLDTWTGSVKAKAEFGDFNLTYPHRHADLRNCVNTTGAYLTNSKNAHHCFIAVRVEDSKYFESGDTIKDSYDCLSGGEQELCYECINPDNSSRTAFTSYSHKDTNTFYSDSCQSCEDVFGCVGLKKARYCIFNKQYSKEAYYELRSSIVEHMKRTGEWGEYFPTKYSLFGYNETVAQDEYPLAQGEAAAKGFAWKSDIPVTKGKETLREVPDSIADVPDSLVQEMLACETCGRNYRVLIQELVFYRKNRIPIPRFCFFCRLKDLYAKRGPVKLWRRSCQCAGTASRNGIYLNTVPHRHGSTSCTEEFETSHAPERPEIVYCEQCYNAEVV